MDDAQMTALSMKMRFSGSALGAGFRTQKYDFPSPGRGFRRPRAGLRFCAALHFDRQVRREEHFFASASPWPASRWMSLWPTGAVILSILSTSCVQDCALNVGRHEQNGPGEPILAARLGPEKWRNSRTCRQKNVSSMMQFF